MLKKFIIHLILVSFFFTSLGSLPDASAQTLIDLPAPGMMVNTSNLYQPLQLKGILVNNKNPLRFDFLVDKGDSNLLGQPLKDEIIRAAKYFLTCLAVPENDLWVNLSPYEKDRIVPGNFGITLMGKDLLEQDYLLKQIMASLSYPENDLGKVFWQKVYRKSYELFGTTNIPINTFNKVWILPKSANVYVQGNAAFVVNSKLDVMLEADYKAFTHHSGNSQNAGAYSQIFRDVILPQLRQEVNEGNNFARIRQVYNAMILATWYKRHLKDSLLGRMYIGRNQVMGIDIADKDAKERIFKQYLRAYKKCVYNYIREDYDPLTQQTVPRKYASGGVSFTNLAMMTNVYHEVGTDRGMIVGNDLARATIDLAAIDGNGEKVVNFLDRRRTTHTEPLFVEYQKSTSLKRILGKVMSMREFLNQLISVLTLSVGIGVSFNSTFLAEGFPSNSTTSDAAMISPKSGKKLLTFAAIVGTIGVAAIFAPSANASGHTHHFHQFTSTERKTIRENVTLNDVIELNRGINPITGRHYNIDIPNLKVHWNDNHMNSGWRLEALAVALQHKVGAREDGDPRTQTWKAVETYRNHHVDSQTQTPASHETEPSTNRETNVQPTAPQSTNSEMVTHSTLPDAPTQLTVQGGDQKVTLNWFSNSTDTSTGISYSIERSVDSNDSYTTIRENIRGTHYQDINLRKGTTYYYKIKAHNDAGYSLPSSEVNATTTAGSPPPPPDHDDSKIFKALSDLKKHWPFLVGIAVLLGAATGTFLLIRSTINKRALIKSRKETGPERIVPPRKQGEILFNVSTQNGSAPVSEDEWEYELELARRANTTQTSGTPSDHAQLAITTNKNPKIGLTLIDALSLMNSAFFSISSGGDLKTIATNFVGSFLTTRLVNVALEVWHENSHKFYYAVKQSSQQEHSNGPKVVLPNLLNRIFPFMQPSKRAGIDLPLAGKDRVSNQRFGFLSSLVMSGIVSWLAFKSGLSSPFLGSVVIASGVHLLNTWVSDIWNPSSSGKIECGDSGFMWLNRGSGIGDIEQNFYPQYVEDGLDKMWQISSLRGDQGKGVVTWAETADGDIVPVITKALKSKRGRLVPKVVSANFRRELRRAARQGLRPYSGPVRQVMSHDRFLTQGEPSLNGLHPHPGPIKKRILCGIQKGEYFQRERTIVDIVIENGDNDNHRKHGILMSTKKIREFYPRKLHMEKTERLPDGSLDYLPSGDAPALAVTIQWYDNQGDFVGASNFSVDEVFYETNEESMDQNLNEEEENVLGQFYLGMWDEDKDELLRPKYVSKNKTMAELFVTEEEAKHDPKKRPQYNRLQAFRKKIKVQLLAEYNKTPNGNEVSVNSVLRRLHALHPNKSIEQKIDTYVDMTVKRFFTADILEAAREVDVLTEETGQYSVRVISSKCPNRGVFWNRGQGLALGINRKAGYIAYNSEATALMNSFGNTPMPEEVLYLNSAGKGQLTDTDVEYKTDSKGAEIEDFKIRVYSLDQQRFLETNELKEWSQDLSPDNEYFTPLVNRDPDNLANEDIADMPRAVKDTNKNWETPNPVYFGDQFGGEFSISALEKRLREYRGVNIAGVSGLNFLNRVLLMKDLHLQYPEIQLSDEEKFYAENIQYLDDDELKMFNRSLIDRGDPLQSPECKIPFILRSAKNFVGKLNSRWVEHLIKLHSECYGVLTARLMRALDEEIVKVQGAASSKTGTKLVARAALRRAVRHDTRILPYLKSRLDQWIAFRADQLAMELYIGKIHEDDIYDLTKIIDAEIEGLIRDDINTVVKRVISGNTEFLNQFQKEQEELSQNQTELDGLSQPGAVALNPHIHGEGIPNKPSVGSGDAVLYFAGIEDSLWIGAELFKKMWNEIFETMPIETDSSNKSLDLKPHKVGRRTLIQDISKSGATSPSKNFIPVAQAISPGNVSIWTGRVDTLMGLALGQRYYKGAPFCNNIFPTGNDYPSEVNSVSNIELLYNQIQLLLYTIENMKKIFPNERPWGMNISEEEIAKLKEWRDSVLNKTEHLTGADETGHFVEEGRYVENESIVKGATVFGRMIKETPLVITGVTAWVFSTTFLECHFGFPPKLDALPLAIGWAAFSTLFAMKIVKRLVSLGLRWKSGRVQKWGWIGPPKVVIMDDSVIHQVIEINGSKRSAMAIQTMDVDYHGGNPQDHAGPRFLHRVRPGISALLYRLPENLYQQANVNMTKGQSNIVTDKSLGYKWWDKIGRIFTAGPEIFTFAYGEINTLSHHHIDLGPSETIDINAKGEVVPKKDVSEKLRIFHATSFATLDAIIAYNVFFNKAYDDAARFGRWWIWKPWQSFSKTKVLSTPSPQAGPKETLPEYHHTHKEIADIIENLSTSKVDHVDALSEAVVATRDKAMLAGEHINNPGGIDMNSGLLEFNVTGRDQINSIGGDSAMSSAVIRGVVPKVSNIVTVTPEMLKDMLGAGYLN